MKIKDLGEELVVDKIIDLFRSISLKGSLEFDDDASSFYIGNNLYYVLNIDGFSSYNSKYPWNSWESFGWKAVTACSSDLIAKGAKPILFLNSIGVPKDQDFSVLRSIIHGIREGIRYYNGLSAGGDINASAMDIWIDVACIGAIYNTTPIPRKANAENSVIVVGRYGASYIAMHLYNLFIRGEIDIADVPETIIKKTSWPKARLEILDILYRYREHIDGAIDTSDGLARTLYLISKKSNRIINLEIDTDDLVKSLLDPEIENLIYKYDLDPLEVIFNGGEEFEVVMFVKNRYTDPIIREINNRGIPAIKIGSVSNQKGIDVKIKNKSLNLHGFKHF